MSSAPSPEPSEQASGEDREPDSAPDEEGIEHPPTAPEHPVPAPGEPPGSMWPGVYAARADADEEDDVSGVEDTALAPPGKPDGEADTRP